MHSKWRYAKDLIEANGESCSKSQAKELAYPSRKRSNKSRKGHGRQ